MSDATALRTCPRHEAAPASRASRPVLVAAALLFAGFASSSAPTEKMTAKIRRPAGRNPAMVGNGRLPRRGEAIVGHGERGIVVVRRGRRIHNQFLPDGNGIRYVRHANVTPDAKIRARRET